MGISGNVNEIPLVREGQILISDLLNNPKNLASPSDESGLDTPANTKRLVSEMRREPQNSSIPALRFQSGGGLIILVELVVTVV